jgi:diadenosine tetraphosphate (Ap4A) HIT family hydrolase
MYANKMLKPECLFCDYKNPDEHTIIADDELAYARLDNFPVSEGHTEIIPKRHVESFFDLREEEVMAVYGLTKAIKKLIVAEHQPDGFTIGVNEGEAAGRTIHHMHLHLIPRYLGDVPNPRGGVRHVIPEKGNY